MAYTFQSRATADLMMLKTSAEQVLQLLDRPFGVPGILTVAQIPAALQALEQAAAEDEARRKSTQEALLEEQESDQQAGNSEAVSLRQRIVPLADMLRRSQEQNQPVTWKA